MKSIILLILFYSLLSGYAHSQPDSSPVARYRINRGPDYYPKIIEAALESTRANYGDYVSEPFAPHIPTLRIISEVAKGTRLNIHWTPAISDLDTNLVSIIPIPLLKGLSGFRILAIREIDQSRFDQVKAPQQFNTLKLAQVHGWFDVKIYQHNNINVIRGARYDSLFAMLSAGRVGAIPVGAEQISDSLNKRSDRFPNLSIEKNLIIYYPLPVFLYVSKKAPMIEKRLRVGLENIIASGEFDRIFYEGFGSTIRSLNFKKRKLFILENPFLYKDTPIKRKELWLHGSLQLQ